MKVFLMRLSKSLPAFAVALVALATQANAGSYVTEAAFYRGIAGSWQGPGEIVAGKYKGTKFTCLLSGDAGAKSGNGLGISGSCRVGVFAQPITALVERNGRGLSGKFLDGEAGDGMDVVGGRFAANRLTVDIKRKDLRGVMAARLTGDDKLNITISVRVGSRLIPVIGMSLDRQGGSDRVVTSSVYTD